MCGFDPCMGHSLKSWNLWSLQVPSHSEYSVILLWGLELGLCCCSWAGSRALTLRVWARPQSSPADPGEGLGAKGSSQVSNSPVPALFRWPEEWGAQGRPGLIWILAALSSPSLLSSSSSSTLDHCVGEKKPCGRREPGDRRDNHPKIPWWPQNIPEGY